MKAVSVSMDCVLMPVLSVPVGITTGIQPGHLRDRGSIPGSFTKFCPVVSVQTDALSHPAS